MHAGTLYLRIYMLWKYGTSFNDPRKRYLRVSIYGRTQGFGAWFNCSTVRVVARFEKGTDWFLLWRIHTLHTGIRMDNPIGTYAYVSTGFEYGTIACMQLGWVKMEIKCFIRIPIQSWCALSKCQRSVLSSYTYTWVDTCAIHSYNIPVYIAVRHAISGRSRRIVN